MLSFEKSKCALDNSKINKQTNKHTPLKYIFWNLEIECTLCKMVVENYGILRIVNCICGSGQARPQVRMNPGEPNLIMVNLIISIFINFWFWLPWIISYAGYWYWSECIKPRYVKEVETTIWATIEFTKKITRLKNS